MKIFFKKYITILLTIMFIGNIVSMPAFAAITNEPDGIDENISIEEFVSDLHKSNVVYSVYNSEGTDVTDLFDLETRNMTPSEINEYMRTNVLMIRKRYISMIQPRLEGGTENFVRQCHGYVMPRSGNVELDLYFRMNCSVTWDSNYGIYSGYATVDSSSFSSHNAETVALVSSSPYVSISGNRRTITYYPNMTVGAIFLGLNSPYYYDVTTQISTSWSC